MDTDRTNDGTEATQEHPVILCEGEAGLDLPEETVPCPLARIESQSPDGHLRAWSNEAADSRMRDLRTRPARQVRERCTIE